MTTNNTTGEYPLRTLDEMRAARERGDEICINGKHISSRSAVLVDSDDLITLTSTGWTARPRKPKEFDFWEAMRAVYEGRASKACSSAAYVIRRRNHLMWNGREPLEICTVNAESKWTLIDNDGNIVVE